MSKDITEDTLNDLFKEENNLLHNASTTSTIANTSNVVVANALPGQPFITSSVPEGFKAILVRQEFNSNIQAAVDEIETSLSLIGGIKSQDDAVKANATLKRAKQLIKTLSEERKLMTSVLDEEKKKIMSYEENIIGRVEKMASLVNKSITDFQTEEFRKQQEREKELQKKRDEEVRLAQEESNRKAKIERLILDFENSVLKACASATIDDIDEKIKKLASVKINKDTYMEYESKAEIMYQTCVTKMNERKIELMKLAEAEKTNQAEAARLRIEQEEKARIDSENQKRKADEAQVRLENERKNEVANSQMSYELSVSQGEGIKGVQKRWSFDPATIDMSLLPEEYKTFDEKKIKEAIAAGCREIPGVKIEHKIINTSR